MKSWLATVCGCAVIFSLLEWCLGCGALKSAARFALGLLFTALVLSGLEGVYGL